MKVTDQLNRTLTLKQIPLHIVSLVPSLTELLCDLGLENSLVGITKFCVHPKHLRKEIAIIGGTKKVKVERIKKLLPDIIIANKEENTQEIIDELKDIAPIHISDIYNIVDCLELIADYGKIFARENEALSLITSIEEKVASFSDYINSKEIRSVAYFIWKNPWMVVASDTFIDFMLTLNNFQNAYSNQKRYPEIEIQSLIDKKLDIIFLSSEPYPFKEKHVIELSEMFPQAKVVIVDGEMFSWYGSRILKALDYFKNLNKKIR